MEPEAPPLLALQAQAVLASDRLLQAVLVVAPISSARTKLQLVDSLVDNQAQLLRVDCSEQHLNQRAQALEAQEPLLARQGAVQLLSGPPKRKTSLTSLVVPLAGLEVVTLVVDCSLILGRPDLERTRRHKARARSVPSARKISRVSRVKTKTNQEVSLEAGDLDLRRRHRHSPLAASLVRLSRRQAVADCSAALRLGKALLGLGVLVRVPEEVFLVGPAHNNRSQVCLVGLAPSEARRTKALVVCSVAQAPLRNRADFLEQRGQISLVVSSATISSNRSLACSEPASLIQQSRTTVSSAGNRPTVYSTLHNRANKHLNNLKHFILPSWMAILMVSRQSGLDFLKLPHKILDRL